MSEVSIDMPELHAPGGTPGAAGAMSSVLVDGELIDANVCRRAYFHWTWLKDDIAICWQSLRQVEYVRSLGTWSQA